LCLEIDIFAKTKANAVKQEVEKLMETVRSASRLVVLIKKVADSSDSKLLEILARMKGDGGLDKNVMAEIEAEIDQIVSQ
jgi:hypothetical protein